MAERPLDITIRTRTEGGEKIDQTTDSVRRMEDSQTRLSRAAESHQRATRSQTAQLQRLRAELERTQGSANRISFTFRRLFGILAAFTAARLAVSAFNNAIRETVGFMQDLELAESGIAAVIAATTDMFDASGRVTDAQQRMAIANQESARQLRQLRIEAMETANTFDDLVRMFSAAIAPGVGAGLSLDEIRQVTMLMAQAGVSMGADAQRIETDIRSIFEGTISQQRTGIARRLQITDEDVRRAREAGELFEFLQRRLEAFSVAGEDATQTVRILQTNVRDAMLQIGQAGFEPLFEEARQILLETLAAAREFNKETGEAELNPQLVQIASAFGDGLAHAASQLREIRDNVEFEDALRTAEALGAAIGTGAEILEGMARGIVGAIGDISRVLTPVLRAFGFVGDLFGERTLSNIVALFTRLFIIYSAFSAIARTVARLMSLKAIAAESLANALRRAEAANAGLAVQSALVSRNMQRSAAAANATVLGAIRLQGAFATVSLWVTRIGGFLLRFAGWIGLAVTAGIILWNIFRDTDDEANKIRESVDAASDALGGAADDAERFGRSFQGPSEALRNTVDLLEEMAEEAARARRELLIVMETLGMEGVARDIRADRVEAFDVLREDLSELVGELDLVQNQFAELERTRRQFRQGVVQTFEETGGAELRRLQSEIASIQNEAQALDVQLQQFFEQTREIEEARDRAMRDARAQETGVFGPGLAEDMRRFHPPDPSGLRLVELQQRIAEIVHERAQIQERLQRFAAQEAAMQERINDLKEARSDLIEGKLIALALNARRIAEEERHELQQQLPELQAQVDEIERMAEIRRRLASDPEFSMADALQEQFRLQVELEERAAQRESAARQRRLNDLRGELQAMARLTAIMAPQLTRELSAIISGNTQQQIIAIARLRRAALFANEEQREMIESVIAVYRAYIATVQTAAAEEQIRANESRQAHEQEIQQLIERTLALEGTTTQATRGIERIIETLQRTDQVTIDTFDHLVDLGQFISDTMERADADTGALEESMERLLGVVERLGEDAVIRFQFQLEAPDEATLRDQFDNIMQRMRMFQQFQMGRETRGLFRDEMERAMPSLSIPFGDDQMENMRMLQQTTRLLEEFRRSMEESRFTAGRMEEEMRAAFGGVSDSIRAMGEEFPEHFRELRDLWHALREDLADDRRLTQMQQQFVDTFNAIGSAMENALGDTLVEVMRGSFSDISELLNNMFTQIHREIARLIVRMAIIRGVVNPLMNIGLDAMGVAGENLLPTLSGANLPSAKGNIFQQQSFAAGGLIPHPQTFAMGGGMRGLAGESGIEGAIAPLMRDTDGSLGVRIVGDDTGDGRRHVVVNQTFHVHTQDADSFRRARRQIMDDARRAVAG